MATVNSSDILEKKVLHELNNGNNVGQFILNYIKEKSYKSYRTFAKRLYQITERLYKNNDISEKEYDLIKEVIKEKLSSRSPEIIFDIESFFRDYLELFDIYKCNPNHPMNSIFFALPLIFSRTFADMQTLKVSEVKYIDLTNSVLFMYKSDDGKKYSNVRIEKYYKEWVEIYKIICSDKSETDLIFPKELMTSLAAFNLKMEPYLMRYTTKKISHTRMLTIIKNSLKYSYNFCSII